MVIGKAYICPYLIDYKEFEYSDLFMVIFLILNRKNLTGFFWWLNDNIVETKFIIVFTWTILMLIGACFM